MANIVSSALANHPFFLQTESGDGSRIIYTAADFTRFTAGIIPRSGVLGSSHFLVVQADNVGMAIKVNSGYANVGGKYLVHMTGDETIELGDGSGSFSGSPSTNRTHKVYLSVYNKLIRGSEYAAKIDVVEDTGTGANPPPNADATLQLATISVRPNQGNIQNQHITNTARHGGVSGEYVYLAEYLNGGFLPAGADNSGVDVRARYENGRVFLSGAIKRAPVSGNSPPFANGGSYDIGVMHSNLRPAHNVFMSGPCSIYDSGSDNTGTYHWRLSIGKDGTMQARLPTGTGPKYLFFDGMSYDLD